MDRVDGLLQKVLQKRGLQSHASASLVVHHAQKWIEETFPTLADSLVATTHKDGTLTIMSAHSIAAQAFQEQKEQCLAYLKENCNHNNIFEIRILRQ